MLPFHTDRLIVRPPEQSDLPTLFAILGDVDVMKLALYERPFSESEARRFIESDFARDRADVTKLGVVCRRSPAGPIGFAGIFPCQYLPGELEFGFVFATHAQGQGFATEVGRKLIDVGFRELGRDRMHALCNPHNMASREVLSRKLGMTFIAEISTPDRGPRSVFRRLRNE